MENEKKPSMNRDDSRRFPSQKELEQELSTYLSKKYGGRVKIIAPFFFPRTDEAISTIEETDANIIKRSIEFPPEYLRAGISILSNFGNILRKKYPGKNAKVRIEQEELKVTMVIEPFAGEKEIIEEYLDQYGLVIRGDMSPEEFTDDPVMLLELKNELRLAVTQIENQRDILRLQDRQIKEKDTQIKELFSLIREVAQKSIPPK